MTPQTVKRERVRPRAGARIAVLLALPMLGLAACDEDPFVFRWNATPDTVRIYSLDRPEPNLPSGFGFLDRALVRVETPGATGVVDAAVRLRAGDLAAVRGTASDADALRRQFRQAVVSYLGAGRTPKPNG